MRLVGPLVLAALASAPVASRALAQAPDDDAAAPRVEVAAGYEFHLDHFRYTFSNPSNIDTDFPVPHRFTQQYIATNHWLVGRARYRVFGDWMQTEAGWTPERQTPGSDIDTFDDPGGDVVTSGTAGDVRIRSLRIAEWSETRLFGLPWRAGYVFSRDRSKFLPADRILTHSQPPSELRTPTSGRETTISQAHEIAIEASAIWRSEARWRIHAAAGVSPLIWARLITRLPDKYPGRDVVFDARAFGVTGALQLGRERGWPVTVSFTMGQTWGYREIRQFRRTSLAAGITASIR